MPKVIAAFNMTLDGNCDHTAGVMDDEVHQHYTDLLNESGTILYGRTTYRLMEDYWPSLVKTPGDQKSFNDFAVAIENIQKVLFSRTVKNVNWNRARVCNGSLSDEIAALRKSETKNILIGSRSLIIQALNEKLVDEFQLIVHPVIDCGHMKLFDTIEHGIQLQLVQTKSFATSGCVLLNYKLIW